MVSGLRQEMSGVYLDPVSPAPLHRQGQTWATTAKHNRSQSNHPYLEFDTIPYIMGIHCLHNDHYSICPGGPSCVEYLLRYGTLPSCPVLPQRAWRALMMPPRENETTQTSQLSPLINALFHKATHHARFPLRTQVQWLWWYGLFISCRSNDIKFVRVSVCVYVGKGVLTILKALLVTCFSPNDS